MISVEDSVAVRVKPLEALSKRERTVWVLFSERKRASCWKLKLKPCGA